MTVYFVVIMPLVYFVIPFRKRRLFKRFRYYVKSVENGYYKEKYT